MDIMERVLERRPWLTSLILGALCILALGPYVLGLQSDQALGNRDVVSMFHPWLTYVVESVRTDEFPLWNPHVFAGYPFIANSQLGLFYPVTWLVIAFGVPVNLFLALSTMGHLWLGGAGMARLLRGFGSTWSGALLAGVVFSFSEYMAARIWAGHYTLLLVSCWLPWTLVAYRWAMRRGTFVAAALAGLVLSLATLAGHMPTVIYLALGLAGVWLYEATRRRDLKLPTRQLLVMGVFAGAVSAVQLVPVAELGRLSHRAADFGLAQAGRYMMQPVQLVTAIVPDLFSTPTASVPYWGAETFEELTFYLSLFPLFGLVFALRRRSPETWLFLGWGVLGVVLSLGNIGGLFTVLYHWVPIFRVMRSPGRATFLVVVAFAGLAGLLLSWLQRTEPEARRAELRPWVRVSAGATVVLIALSVLAMTVYGLRPPDLQMTRLQSVANAFGLAALAAGGLSIVLWLWSVEGKVSAWMTLLTIGLVLLDLWRVDLPLMRPYSTEPTAPWQALEHFIGPGDDRSYRIMPWGVSIFDQNMGISQGYYSVRGYDALEIGAYTHFLAALEDPRARTFTILNARYIINEIPMESPDIEGGPNLKLLGEYAGWKVYERPNDQPSAFVARLVDVIPDEMAALERINGPGFDPAARVVLAREPPCPVGGGAGTAEIVSYSANEVVLEVESATDTLVVLSDTYYPGWTADVDGETAEVLRADVTLRAVCVPAGTHTVTMRFRPASLAVGGVITLASLGVLLLAGARQKLSRA